MNFCAFPSATRTALVGSLLLASGCVTQPPAPSAPSPKKHTAPARPEGAFEDDQRSPTAREMAVTAAGLDRAKLAAVERELIAVLLAADSTFADRQEAAELLSPVLFAGAPDDHAATLDALAPLLTDPARVDHARLALDRAPGREIDTLYLRALASTTGRARLGLIDSLGTRGVAAAVPALGSLLAEADPATAEAAARALGRIGGPAALDALRQAKDALAPTFLNARLAAAAKADAVTAAQVASEIHRSAAAPLASRALALRGLIAADPAGAIEAIHAALSGGEPAFQAVALESIATLPVVDASARLAARLGAYSPDAQVALIAALGERHDANATPALLLALENPAPEVRLAAINALGRLPGTIEVARRLATLAIGEGDEAKAASTALTRLDGPGLDRFIRENAAASDETLRAVYLRQIAARNLTEAVPFLISLRTAPSENLRGEALDALRLIAAGADQRPIIDWAINATNRNEANRAVRALVAIILREGDIHTRAATVIAALEAGDAVTRQTLLPILARAAGGPALATAAALARDIDESVALAATAELSRWPDAAALPALVGLSVATPIEAVRTSAVQGAARFLVQGASTTAAQRSTQARALLNLPLNAHARLALLNVLSYCADQAALATARRFLADPAVAATAQDAVDAISSNLAGAPLLTASTTEAVASLAVDGKLDTFWSAPNAPGAWLRVDLHNSRPLRKVTLEQGSRGGWHPAKIEILVGENPEQPGEVIAEASGEWNRTAITLPAGTRGRYLWIRQTGSRENAWAVAELRIE